MKRRMLIAAAAVMMLSSCVGESADSGREKTEPPVVGEYMELAEEYYSAGDIGSAIDTLEQGYAETASRRLKNRLEELRKEYDASHSDADNV